MHCLLAAPGYMASLAHANAFANLSVLGEHSREDTAAHRTFYPW